MKALSISSLKIDFRQFSLLAAGGVVLIACTVLAGWWFDVAWMREVVPGLTAMNPGGTAVTFVSIGLSLALQVHTTARRRLIGRICAAGAVSLALLRLGGYVLGWDVGPDQWLFHDRLEEDRLRTGHPNQMAPNTAVALLLLGGSLLILDNRLLKRRHPAQMLALTAAVIGLLAAIGYAYSEIALAGVRHYIPMALNTSLTIALASVGILAARANEGLMAVVTHPGVGGIMARRLIPAAILFPLALGWLRWLGQAEGWVDPLTGLSLLVLGNILAFVSLIWWNAASTNRMERGRQRAEEALRQSEERFRSLIEATAAIVWSTPASGSFVAAQPGWTAFTGQSFDQLKGDGWLEAVHPDDRANTLRAWSAALASCSLYQVEQRLRRRDGEYRHMLVRAIPLFTKDGVLREWVGAHTDVDMEKHAEAVMREAKEAALAATRAKSDFLANMSHEIRTPLNGILGMTELALDSDLTPEQREYLEMAHSSANHLMTVINEILDFSKIEAGRLDLECVDFELRETLDNTLATLAGRAHKKGLELADHVAPDVPDALAGDPHRLTQVLVNLVGNAIKFTEKGEVVVHVELAKGGTRGGTTGPDGEAPAGPGSPLLLHFAVRDTGIGIPYGQRARLFKAFQQADTSTTRKYGGTGLGLTISARLVEMMGGRIWLESEEGLGSTFHFTVQLALARGRRPEPAHPEQVRGLPVLVVDDNATNRRILEEMLTNWGMTPTVVDGGEAALAALRQSRETRHPFSLILLDSLMPGMDGFALAERIKADAGPIAATLMMLSSGSQRDDAARCRALGVAAYLTKPIRQSTLLDSIMTALGPGLAAGGLPAHDKPAWGRADRGLRVLLAEDNLVNQTLALRLLEKRGHQAIVVGNGREAVAAFQRDRFDAILMDVQMPEMDGFEATAAIRTLEQPAGSHVPIIAMTAHALRGDREHCLEAGMDGYVSKPLRPEDLFGTLEGLAGGTPPAPAEPKVEELKAAVFDASAALERTGGDEGLLKELAQLCVAESPHLMEQIQTAVTRTNGPELRLSAHTLKGSVANFSAEEAFQAARRLEQAGHDENWADAGAGWAELKEAMSRLLPALSEFAGRPAVEAGGPHAGTHRGR